MGVVVPLLSAESTHAVRNKADSISARSLRGSSLPDRPAPSPGSPEPSSGSVFLYVCLYGLCHSHFLSPEHALLFCVMVLSILFACLLLENLGLRSVLTSRCAGIP